MLLQGATNRSGQRFYKLWPKQKENVQATDTNPNIWEVPKVSPFLIWPLGVDYCSHVEWNRCLEWSWVLKFFSRM